MIPSRPKLPLLLAIVGTILFDLSPIRFGDRTWINVAFVAYTGVMLVLGWLDRRVLGYCTILLACCPANARAIAPFPPAFALIALAASRNQLGAAVAAFASRKWWLLWAIGTVVAIFSMPLYVDDMRGIVTELKSILSTFGWLVLLPLVVHATMTDIRDAVRATTLTCIVTSGIAALFYFTGTQGVPVDVGETLRLAAREVYMQIGEAAMNLNRTQACILLAALVAGSLGLAVGQVRRPLWMLLLMGGAGVAFYMMMQLASTGSAFAAVLGMGVVGVGFLLLKPSMLRWLMGITAFTGLGWTVVWAVFHTENRLMERINEKMNAGEIDRWGLWVGAVNKVLATPFGSGWTTEFAPGKHCHDDFLVYFLSYGWIGGLLYSAGVILVAMFLFSQTFKLIRSGNREAHAVLLAGAAAVTVYAVNSLLDMLSANFFYYEAVWAVILVPAASLVACSQNAGEQLNPYLEYSPGSV